MKKTASRLLALALTAALVLSGCGGSDRHKGNAARKPKQIQQGEPA